MPNNIDSELYTERNDDPCDLPPLMCGDCDQQVTLGGSDYPIPAHMCACRPQAHLQIQD
jgi:hypothetical protein